MCKRSGWRNEKKPIHLMGDERFFITPGKSRAAQTFAIQLIFPGPGKRQEKTMKNTLAISSVIITLGILSIPLVWGDDDDDHHSQKPPSTNPLYTEECGSCHMAYPPGLLPARSWDKIIAGLEDHFGDNAELDAETAQSISQHLQNNSADQSSYRRSHKFNRSINADDTPMRISDVRYFKHEHNEIPNRMVSGNPQVKSFSQCDACHAKAEQGEFNEHNVRIPGFGKWDD
ncbi:diheme cytochrome c [hydrothermal vent metagenome]|uniref:Diheme cytochrome c n=1 Tax=hydrothermal vent metagenome TaxID=652676 RepID=A0A3B0XPA4_9ZZZZ